MKIVIQDNRRFIIRFDKGEEVIAGLQKFMKEQEVFACSFAGIGACASMELGYFNLHVKDYRKKPYVDEMEIVSLNGNGALKDGEPIIHCHGLFAKNDFTTLAGHVFKVEVSATCEIFLIKLEGKMERKLDPETNLNLLI